MSEQTGKVTKMQPGKHAVENSENHENCKNHMEKNTSKSSMTADKVLPDRNLFMDTIRSVEEMIQTAEKPLTKAEITEYFKDMELSEEQHRLIYQYLQNAQTGRTDTECSNEGCHEAGMQQKESDLNGMSEWEHQSVVKLAGTEEKNTDVEAEMPDSAFFQMYLDDLERIRSCTQLEEEQLYEQLITGDETAVAKLSEQWMPKILELAKKNAVHAGQLADVIQEGNLAVFLALSGMLGSGKREDFRKILKIAAETAMKEYTAETAAAEDSDQSLLAKAALVYEAQKFLAQELQRMPAVSELSQYTKLQEPELENILAILKEKK